MKDRWGTLAYNSTGEQRQKFKQKKKEKKNSFVASVSWVQFDFSF